MALITRSTTASLDKNQAVQASAGLLAGEALDLVAPCYIKSSDGLVYMSNATAADEEAEVVGFTARAVSIGQPVTLFGPGTRFSYGTGLTPGDVLFLGATNGRLDSAATVGDTIGYARVESATDIVIVRSLPVLVSATLGDGTVALTKLAALARGSMISGQTAGNVPTAIVAKGDGKILVGDGTDVNSVSVSGDVTLANTGAVTIAAGAVEQSMIEPGAAGAGLTGLVTKFVAADNVIGGLPVVHKVAIAAGANATKAITFTHKTEIIEIIVRPLTSVAGATCSVTNVANAMSDAMVAAVAGVQTHAASIVPAQKTIAAGAELRVTFAGGATQPDADVYIIGMRVA